MPLAMFDEYVSDDIKVAMVKNHTHLIVYPRGGWTPVGTKLLDHWHFR